MRKVNNQLVESLELLLSTIGRWIKIAHRQCIDKYKELDLTEHQYKVLKVLKAGGPYKMMELGDIIHTSSGSLTVMIDRLVAKDMAERFFMAEDRRVVMVAITGTGEKALEQFRNGLIAILTDKINGFDAEKQRKIAEAVRELQGVFEDIS